jgi:hypothetical protein
MLLLIILPILLFGGGGAITDIAVATVAEVE